MITETVEEFLARGGKIREISPGHADWIAAKRLQHGLYSRYHQEGSWSDIKEKEHQAKKERARNRAKGMKAMFGHGKDSRARLATGNDA